ncbi:phage tail tube protein [Anaerococcus sp. NML200574]|uniref:phage tail tube protein n=1 Tax=Anaerococcus sp. NML200574 TaxID=2954486 RepID=UPI0022382EC7|nr:phage tail tube protein [Anaerococcus sp. NML200574]MCW6678159.1 phage tail tube protein [Anaerococcus sp. NML200574]
MAELSQNKGFRRLSGTWGTLHIDGELIFECEGVEANIEIQRSDVYVNNNLDSKANGLAGTGSITIKHVYTRGVKKYLDVLKAGRDPRFLLSSALSDPDAVGGQKERVNIGNCWVNNLPVTNFTKGEVVEKTYDFGFTPNDVDIAEGVY